MTDRRFLLRWGPLAVPPLYLVVTLGGLVVYALPPALVPALLLGVGTLRVVLAGGVAGAALMVAVVAWGLTRALAVRVGPDRLTAPGRWGRPQAVRWTAPARVHRGTFPAGLMLTVGRGRRGLWVPGTLRDPAGFAAAVAAAAPAHPLAETVRHWRGDAELAATYPDRFAAGVRATLAQVAVLGGAVVGLYYLLWRVLAPRFVPVVGPVLSDLWPLLPGLMLLLAAVRVRLVVGGREWVRVGPVGLVVCLPLRKLRRPLVPLRWDDRPAMELARRLLAPRLVVGGRAVFVPWRAADPDGLLRAVERHAGAGHDLALALAGEPPDDPDE